MDGWWCMGRCWSVNILDVTQLCPGGAVRRVALVGSPPCKSLGNPTSLFTWSLSIYLTTWFLWYHFVVHPRMPHIVSYSLIENKTSLSMLTNVFWCLLTLSATHGEQNTLRTATNIQDRSCKQVDATCCFLWYGMKILSFMLIIMLTHIHSRILLFVLIIISKKGFCHWLIRRLCSHLQQKKAVVVDYFCFGSHLHKTR